MKPSTKHARSTHVRRLRRWSILAALALATVSLPQMNAYAGHLEVSLTGSNFEIDTDANLRLDDAAPSEDWASVDEIRRTEEFTGTKDDSFGQGTKENSTSPKIVTGGIPPNKSDLKTFGVYQEGTDSDGYLNLFWTRVQDPTGTTNMDFELNKLRCTPGTADEDCSANDVTPKRSEGDLLVIYDLSQGGTHPDLFLSEWSGTAWGTPVNLSDADNAAGSINTSAITDLSSTPNDDETDGLGTLSPRTFGEAQIDLSVIFGTGCSSFGSVYLKSRSSDSFTAALKDFVPPVAVDITNCVASTMSSAQSWVPNDTVTITAPSGGDLAGTVTFDLYASGDCGEADGDTAIYHGTDAVAGASPQDAESANTTEVTATGDYSWKVSYDSTNAKQNDIADTCEETTSLTIDNGS
jgi:hypothetical protein